MPEEMVQLKLILLVDEAQEAEVFLEWAEEIGLDIDTLSNSGCGCCVDIYSFATTPAAAQILGERLRAVNGGVSFGS